MNSSIKNNEYIYIFDLNEILLDRYPASIAKSIQEITNKKLKFIFLFCEVYDAEIARPKKLPPNSTVIFERLFNQEILERYVQKYPPAAFVTIGLRIPDIFLLGYFNRFGVKTYMVQHGIFTNHLQRISIFKFSCSKYFWFTVVISNSPLSEGITFFAISTTELG